VTSTRQHHAVLIMGLLGIPNTITHVGARRALTAWMHAESGEHPGLCNGLPGQGARWNPLNTTLALPGCTSYNSVPVRNYAAQADGALAVVRTLEEDTRYAPVIAALRKPFVNVKTVNKAIAASPWGTPGWLLEDARTAYQRNRAFYNTYPIGA